MKRIVASLTLIAFLSITGLACNTNKPAEEVKDAQDRVKDKIETEREKQAEQTPEE